MRNERLIRVDNTTQQGPIIRNPGSISVLSSSMMGALDTTQMTIGFLLCNLRINGLSYEGCTEMRVFLEGHYEELKACESNIFNMTKELSDGMNEILVKHGLSMDEIHRRQVARAQQQELKIQSLDYPRPDSIHFTGNIEKITYTDIVQKNESGKPKVDAVKRLTYEIPIDAPDESSDLERRFTDRLPEPNTDDLE